MRYCHKLELDAPYIAKAAFDGVTCRRIPISSLAVSDRPYARGHVRIDDVEKVVTLDNMSIDGMEGHEFEHFCADLLRKVGFSEVSITPGSGDQGVDVLASKDGIKYAIQCKNYASALSNTPVQEVSAGKQFYGCHVGVVMTNSTFTPGALQLAAATNVLLWDRGKLDEFISKAGGIESLGICTDYTGLDSNDEPEDELDDNFEDDLDVDKDDIQNDVK